MRADLVQDRVAAAQGEARADAGEIHRRTDECLAHAGAVGAVVAGIALLVGIAHGGVGLAAVDEAGGEDIAGRHLLAVDLVLFVDHVELVAFSQIEGEVDVVAEDVRQRRDQVIGQAGVTTGNEQRAGDAAMGIGGMQVDLGFLAFEGVALVGLVRPMVSSSLCLTRSACSSPLGSSLSLTSWPTFR